MKSFADFLQDITAPQTKNAYIASMCALMDSIHGPMRKSKDATKEEKARYMELIEEYLKENRNFYADMITLKGYIAEKAPRTQRSYLYNCRMVIEVCTEKEFTKSQDRNFKSSLLKGTRHPITETEILSHEIIRKILSHATIPARAAILIMCTSGIRIGELLCVDFKHIDIPNRTLHIPAHCAKTKVQRTIYFTEETAEAIRQWVEYRPAYMEQVKKQCTYLIPGYRLSETRLFPMSDSSMREAIENAVKNAGLKKMDKQTNRSTISPHSFRKWFSTVGSMNMPKDVVELLMGHWLPYSGAYTKIANKEIMAIYRKHETCFYIGSDETIRTTIENVSGDVQKIHEENNKLKGEVENLKKIVAELAIKGLYGLTVEGVADQNLNDIADEARRNITFK